MSTVKSLAAARRPGISMALAAMALCIGNVACVNTRTQGIDGQTNTWRGKSVSLTDRPSAAFMPMTAGKAMFGLLGAAAMVESGRKIVAENAIPDPAPLIGQSLRDLTAESYGTIPASIPPVKIDETDVSKLAGAARGSELLFDVRVTGWGFAYKPTLTHYFTMLNVKLRVIDVAKGSVIAEGFCSRTDKQEKDLPTYDQLLADHAALLKSKLSTYTGSCVREFREKVFNTVSPSAS